MHSSIISKIRILKPRKKTLQASKFTIQNENFHSTLKPKDTESNDESPPPPLIPKANDNENETVCRNRNEEAQKWLPVYIVNVPKTGVVGVSASKTDLSHKAKQDSVITTNQKSKPCPIPLTSEETLKLTSNTSTAPLCTLSTRGKSNRKGNFNEKIDNTLNENNSKNSPLVLVSCFLCPLKFKTVAAMQLHYLDNHKHKKRSGAILSNSKSSATSKFVKSIKPKNVDTNISMSGEGEPKCPICSIDFKTKEEVKDHMTNVHCYKCSECKNTFYTLFQFTDHRCSTGVRLKKIRHKKKKIKSKIIDTCTSISKDKDPLALSPKLNTGISSNVIPIRNNSSSESSKSTTLIHVNSEPKNPVIVYPPIVKPKPILKNHHNRNESSTNLVLNSTTVSASKHCDLKLSSKSLKYYSLEELTSKEFNKMKLNEILQNPNLSICFIKPKAPEYLKPEFFSCGRCNVLCEDKSDYTDHIEECLRLSNVSLISSQGPPKRIIKLKAEVIPKKTCNNSYQHSSVNQKLLKELKNYIDSDKSELFDLIESNPLISEEVINKQNANDDDFFHPDIKGNISIKKIRSNSQFKSFRSETTKINPCKKPMVVIPIDKSLQSNIRQPGKITMVKNLSQGLSTNISSQTEDHHYPEISIIDKSNCVTYKFIGTGSNPLLKFESNASEPLMQQFNDKNTSENRFSRSPETKEIAPIKSCFQDKDVQSILDLKETELKSESSTSQLSARYVKFSESNLTEPKEEKYSLELSLDEDEIKMEVEDEVVDDNF